jgi:hypothetical protein
LKAAIKHKKVHYNEKYPGNWMTDDKRKKIELCFDSVEKLVTLKATLSRAVANINNNLETAIERLEDRQFILDGDLNDGLMRLDSIDIEYVQRLYTDSLWETMQILLPHYRTTKE